MSVRSKFVQIVLLAVVSLAVVVTFARSTPVGLPDDDQRSASIVQAVLVIEQSDPAKPNCPCPTEIENADCDDGVCPTGLIQHAADQARAFAPTVCVMPAHDRLGLNRAPEPMPPRRFV